MNPARWQEIELLFHEALALPGSRRAEFLHDRCMTDHSLRTEVDSLLAAYEGRQKILDADILDLGLAAVDGDRMPPLEGRRIGNYLISRKLGEGGMGTVYLAEDTHLDRDVALKFLSSTYLDNEILKKQLLREARAAANLDHPNICSIYAVEEVDGFNFIVMPCIAGESLADVIKRGEHFPAEELLSIVRQIVSAVVAAHAQGVLHRDIKPGNVMRTPDGRIHMLDFGLAKVVSPIADGGANEALPADESGGLLFGTVAYMSPEQLRKERLDYRSDIFSLGTLIFELCTLSNPFARDSQAETIAAVLSGVPDLALLKDAAPPVLRTIAAKCLEKAKDDRYSSTNEILIDLEMEDAVPQPAGRLARYAGRWFLALLLILALAIGAGLYWRLQSHRTYRIAVLPLANATADTNLDYLGSGIAEGVINRMGRQVPPTEVRVMTLTQVSAYGRSADPVAAGKQLGADIVLSGLVSRDGDRMTTTLTATDVAHAERLWSETYAVDTDDLLLLQTNITEHMLNSLQITPQAVKRVQFTESGEAYRHYLIGQYYWRKRDPENIQRAILSFDQAIELDPAYAKAYAGLANAYVVQSLVAYGATPSREAMTRARAAARQAIEIEPDNSEAHTALAVVLFKYDWNWNESENEFRLAIDLNPDYSAAHYWFSSLLAVLGRVDESVAEALLARDLDPFSPLVYVNLTRVYYYARQYDRALDVIQSAHESGIDDPKIRYINGLILLQRKRYAEALPIFTAISADNKLFASAALGYTYAMLGRRKDAERVITSLENDTVSKELPNQEIGIIYAGLNDQARAVSHLEGAYQARHAALVSVKVEPLFDGLRGDQRFRDLLSSMNLN